MHRLRDLSGRQAVVAALMVVLVLVPFGASAVRAAHVHWLPSGDDALIGLRTHDVFTSHRPLVGQPSTSHLYGEQGTSHPGPIEFYWLAVPLRLLGPAVGMIAGALAFNLASVLVAGWVVLRRAGPTVAGWAMVLLSLLLWSEGTAILSDPISSNAGGIPLLALAVLAWAVVDGDIRLLPLGALFGSWVAQQHLAIALPSGGLVAYAAVGVTVGWIARVRRARRQLVDDLAADVDPDDLDADAPAGEAPPRMWPWVVGALAVCAVLWSPVLWQQVTGSPGNLTAVVRYARTSDATPLGWMPAFRQAIRATGFPPLLLRSDLTGRSFFVGPLSALEVVTGVATYVLLIATVIGMWARRRTLALLALTAIVLAAAGTYNGSTIPDSIEAFRINFYRWAFVVAWLSWIVIGWMAAIGVRAVLERRGATVPRLVPRFAPALAVVVMLIPAIGTVATAGYNDERRDQSGFVAMRAMSDAAVAEAGRTGAGDVTVVLRGRSSVLASGPALGLQLESHGHPVLVPEQEARFWGKQRILHPGDDPGDLILQLVSGRGDVPDGPGRTIARVDMNEDLRGVLAPLVEQARSAPVEPSERAEALLAQQFEPENRSYVRGLLADLAASPESVLTDEVLLGLIADGYYASPVFDPDQVDALRAALPAATVNDDDVFELRVLTPDELAEVVPAWGGS